MFIVVIYHSCNSSRVEYRLLAQTYTVLYKPQKLLFTFLLMQLYGEWVYQKFIIWGIGSCQENWNTASIQSLKPVISKVASEV